MTLQQTRHEADYDIGRRFTRDETRAYVELSEQAFEAWSRVEGTPEARLYLGALLSGGRRWTG